VEIDGNFFVQCCFEFYTVIVEFQKTEIIWIDLII